MRWDDARVIVFGLLCRPDGPGPLLDDVAGALDGFEQAHQREPGRWVTAGMRLRRPRSHEEHAELLLQPDDPQAAERVPMVSEIAGRGSRRSAEGAEGAVCRALCPEEFHPGPARFRGTQGPGDSEPSPATRSCCSERSSPAPPC